MTKRSRKWVASACTLFFATHAMAQDYSFNDQIKAIDRQYQQQIFQAQSNVSQAQIALNNCPVEYDSTMDQLEEKPDGTAAMVQGIAPGLVQSAPALTEMLSGAKNDAESRVKTAVEEYNLSLAALFQIVGVNGDPSLRNLDVNAKYKNSDNLPSSSTVRNNATTLCGKVSADPTKYNTCISQANALAATLVELRSKADLNANTQTSTGILIGSVATAALGGFMAHTQNKEAEKNIDRQNDILKKTADRNLEACKVQRQNDLNNAKRGLAQLELDRADQLRDMAMRNAMAMNELNNGAINVDDNTSKTLPPTNPGSPDPVKAPSALAANDQNGGGGGGGGGGVGGSPGGAAGSAGDPAWNFGGPQGNFLGGGLPAQEAGASFESSGGGNVTPFVNSNTGSGGLNLSLGTGADTDSSMAGERGLASIGDGGLQVMMARMRIRLAYHATELMSGTTLKSVASQQSTAAEKNEPATSASAN